jgi:F0F1-type ATP synthase membrane subunit c/vacuolar-type H+-ATPase subunit K
MLIAGLGRGVLASRGLGASRRRREKLASRLRSQLGTAEGYFLLRR